MLASDPAQRFQSGGDVVRALDGLAPVSGNHLTGELLLKGRRKRRRARTWSIVGAGVVVAAAAAWALTRGRIGGAAPVPADTSMASIPGGEYTVGADAGSQLSRPAHTVTLAPFSIDKDEVSSGAYARFVETGRAPPPWTARPESPIPVTGVSYAEAASYCAWKHDPGGRLPTEAEWEAAARGKAARRYPWGDAWNASAANTQSAHRSGPQPVGSNPSGATPEGIRDMVGNVWEWTMTPMAPYPGGAAIPNLLPSQYYVIRGGAYNTPDSTASPSLRGYAPPNADRTALDKTGFRCAMPAKVTPTR